MELIIKHFDELTAAELHEIYKLRCEVFVVEQNCPYQDIDRHDKNAFHLWLLENGEMVAYARALPAGATFESPAIGRIIAKVRRKGYGTRIVKEAINVAVERYGAELITIEAQVYARSLYEKCGFVGTSDEFLEDGIPHIEMQWKCLEK